jgi:hypothetical protein
MILSNNLFYRFRGQGPAATTAQAFGMFIAT